jgi:hypothetical protein
MVRGTLAAATLALVVGCRAPRREIPTTAPSASASSVVEVEPGLALLEPPDAATPVREAPDLGWVAVAQSPRLYDLYPLDTTVLVGSDGKLWETTPSGLAARSRFLDASGEPAPVGWVQSVHGHWPDNAWAIVWPSAPRSEGEGRSGVSVGSYIRWQKDHWVFGDSTSGGARVAWSEGRVLVGTARWIGGGGPLPEGSTVGDYKCLIHMGRIAATAIASEHVFALGTGATHGSRCLAKDQSTWVEHYEPGQTHGRLDRLPPLSEEWAPYAQAIDARAPDDVVVAGYVETRRQDSEVSLPYVARYDGKRWSLVQPPPTRSLPIGLARTSDGTLWIATSTNKYGRSEHNKRFASSSDLWRKPLAGAWERVAALPHVFDVAADKSGAVWVSAAISERAFALMRAR